MIVEGDQSPWRDLKADLRPALVEKLCQKTQTDGFLFLLPEGPSQYRWDFYNRDGSNAEMCGNAARCALAYLVENKGIHEANFITRAGNVRAVHESSAYQMTMPAYRVLEAEASVMNFTGAWVDTGVPHFVVKLDDYENHVFYKERASQLRRHPHFGVKGANVTFYREKSSYDVDAVTFERGVEDFTPACGTGAVAAALVQLIKNSQKTTLVKMPGGDIQVEFFEGSQHPLMSGSAEKTEEFKINLEDYL